MFKFNLGDEVKDQLTGFKGYIASRADYITGCNRYGLLQKVQKDGNIPNWQWFDEPSLTLIKANAIKLPDEEKPKKQVKPGGSRSANQTPPSGR